jgi:methylenetetrahydrofolate dehydrogenase (NADP+) / methenyltetrahydrofolate cyclohydrolase
MKILAAKPVVEVRRKLVLQENEARLSHGLRAPHLAVILVGDDPASHIYVSNKGKACEAVGFTHETLQFESNVDPKRVQGVIEKLNQDPLVSGILVQRPLPKQFIESEVIYWVDPKKDVDCLHPENLGLILAGQPRFLPCTPGGILSLLDYYKLDVAGKISCVIGRSSIVGKPLAAMLLARNATVIQVHRGTQNPEALCKQADFVFVAAGSPRLLKSSWIKPGAVVVDVGIHRDAKGAVFGDADIESLGDLPSAITPVPGGVGPMTIQTLLENTLKSTLK